MSRRNIKRRKSGANIYKENLQYYEKERNVNDIIFEPRKLFDPCQNFMEPRNPRDLRKNFDVHKNFMNPHHPPYAIFLTHSTHVPMLPTSPTLCSRLRR